MRQRNLLAAVFVATGITWAFGVEAPNSRTQIQSQASQELGTYRNAKNEICETVDGKVQCLSERAYQKEQVMRERRAGSYRESLHDRVD